VSDVNGPLLGEPSAPCRTCGAPQAADQRYCLQCGARRAEARLPFLEILARQVPQGAAAATVTTTTRATGGGRAGPWPGRIGTNAAAIAGVACLLLALGVGVLIGGLGSDDASAGAGSAPQVISVGGAAPAAAPVVAASSTAPAGGETAAQTSTTPAAKHKITKKTSAATTSAVKDLDGSSGGDYAKKSEKLPKTLGTGGTAPPVDKSKPIGGGSDTEEIG
jgi:hypothetical protein